MSTKLVVQLVASIMLPIAALIFGYAQFRATTELGRQQADRDLRMKFVDFTWSAIQEGDTATVSKALTLLASVDRVAAMELAKVVNPPPSHESGKIEPVRMVAVQGLAITPITFAKRVPLSDWESSAFSAARVAILKRYPGLYIHEERTRRTKWEETGGSSAIGYGHGEEEFGKELRALVDSVLPSLTWVLYERRDGETGLLLSLKNPEH